MLFKCGVVPCYAIVVISIIVYDMICVVCRKYVCSIVHLCCYVLCHMVRYCIDAIVKLRGCVDMYGVVWGCSVGWCVMQYGLCV